MDPHLHRPREIQAGRMAQKVVDRKSSLEIESNMSQARFHDDKLNQDSILIPQSEQVFWASLKGIQYLGEILGSCTENALICFWFVVLYFWCFYSLKDHYLRRNLRLRGKLMFPMAMPRVRRGNFANHRKAWLQSTTNYCHTFGFRQILKWNKLSWVSKHRLQMGDLVGYPYSSGLESVDGYNCKDCILGMFPISKHT